MKMNETDEIHQWDMTNFFDLRICRERSLGPSEGLVSYMKGGLPVSQLTYDDSKT